MGPKKVYIPLTVEMCLDTFVILLSILVFPRALQLLGAKYTCMWYHL